MFLVVSQPRRFVAEDDKEIDPDPPILAFFDFPAFFVFSDFP